MKKILTGVLAAVVVAVSTVTGSVQAVGVPGQTDITGVVTENQVAVANAEVTILCNGNTKTDTSDAHGSYLATYLGTDCPFGSTVKVTAQKDGKSGVASGTVQGITTKLNLAIVNVAIPEYGMIGVLIAGSASIGLIAYMRRQNQYSQF